MTKRIRELLNYALRIGISGLLLWYLFAKVINLKDTVELLKNADIKYICYAFCSFIVIMILLLVRWFIYIKALGLTVSRRNVVRYYLIGLFGNLFLPSAIGGDIIKIMGLCSESSHKARVVASVLLDRLSGFVAIVIIAVCSFALGYGFIEDKTLVIPIATIGVVMVGLGVVLFNEKVYAFFCSVFNIFPKVKKKVMDLHYDISLLKDRKRDGYNAIMVSCVSQLTFAFTFFLSAKALHQDVNIIYFIIFVPLICIASMVPSLGGLGAREAGAVYLFSKIGIAPGVAASMSLISFLFVVIVGLIGGLIYVITLSSGRVQHKQSTSD